MAFLMRLARLPASQLSGCPLLAVIWPGFSFTLPLTGRFAVTFYAAHRIVDVRQYPDCRCAGAEPRERMRIAGAPLGSRGNSTFSPRVIWQSMTHPEWALRMLMNGGARFRNMEPYANGQRGMAITKFIGSQLNGSLDWDYLAEIRQQWHGNCSSRAFCMPRMRSVP